MTGAVSVLFGKAGLGWRLPKEGVDDVVRFVTERYTIRDMDDVWPIG